MKLNVEQEALKEIIKGCTLGNRKDQERLFKHFYGKMLGVCMLYTKDKDSAQEVVQEGFIKIFDKLGEFDFKGSFEGWIRRIMVNASIDATRKLKRSPIRTDETYLFLEKTEEDNFDFEQLTKLKAKYAVQAIQQLSPAYKAVFNLYVIENYTHKEIGEILNISEGTSKSNLAKAKMKLKKLLEEKFVKIDG